MVPNRQCHVVMLRQESKTSPQMLRVFEVSWRCEKHFLRGHLRQHRKLEQEVRKTDGS